MQTYNNTVNGKAVTSTVTFDVRNPANLEEFVGKAPVSTHSDVTQAVQAARQAGKDWANRPDSERKAFLKQVATAIHNNSEYLAELITKEQGKPLGGVGPDQVPGSRFEVWGCEAWVQVPASLDLPVDLAFEDDTRKDEVHRKPYGVIAAIAPWNWPLLIAIWQIIPSIRSGNTVVIKPSEYTTISTLELVRIINEVLPAGVVNCVSGDGSVGKILVENTDIDKIMFTGSAATGSKIATIAAERLIPTTMELGGNDAAIVLDDVNPKEIAMGLFWGAFINMGQTCACAKRLYVHEKVHDEIVSEMQILAENMPMGNGMDDGIVMGPIQNKMQYDKVSTLVEDAKAQGAQIICGGSSDSQGGYFYPLTLLTNVKDGDRIVDEEQFGPVLPIIKYTDIESAIESANRLNVGLGASVWSSDTKKAQQIAQRVEAGTVWINQHGTIHPMVPFGGIKGSGYGVEFGIEGLKSVTYPQVISTKK